jgi:hypothetical protein
MSMSDIVTTSLFDQAIETVESLSPEEQEMLVEIIHQRLIQQRRKELAKEIQTARESYQAGHVRHGNVSELMAEISKWKPWFGTQRLFMPWNGWWTAILI